MGFFHSFERKVEDGVEGAASMFEGSSLTPVQITKKAEKQMKREKMVGAGRQIAPTLYTCIVSATDDAKLYGYYATLAGEVETYLQAKASDLGYSLDCKPLVRFVVDPDLKKGKFDVIAELVSSPTIDKLRAEEYEKYGLPMSKPSANVNKPRDVRRTNVALAGAVSPGVEAKQNVMREVKGARRPMMQPDIEKTQVVGQVASVPEPQDASGAGEVYFYDEVNDFAYRLSGNVESIGRESSNDIVVSDINASRHHANVYLDQTGKWIIEDAGSTNGLYVNGKRVRSAQLIDADIVLIGTTRLEFQNLS